MSSPDDKLKLANTIRRGEGIEKSPMDTNTIHLPSQDNETILDNIDKKTHYLDKLDIVTSETE